MLLLGLCLRLIVHIVHYGRGDLLDGALDFRRDGLQQTHTVRRRRRCGRCALRQQRVGQSVRQVTRDGEIRYPLF